MKKFDKLFKSKQKQPKIGYCKKVKTKSLTELDNMHQDELDNHLYELIVTFYEHKVNYYQSKLDWYKDMKDEQDKIIPEYSFHYGEHNKRYFRQMAVILYDKISNIQHKLEMVNNKEMNLFKQYSDDD